MTPEQYENAARAVHVALQERNATSNRRLHIDRYKSHAAKVLDIKSVYPGRWAEVIDAGERLRLFKVDRETLQKPIFVDLKPRTTDEDTEDEPTVNGPMPYRPVTQPDQAVCVNTAFREKETATAELVQKIAVLVKFPDGHADGHRGLHVYLDDFFTPAEEAQLVQLAKTRGATVIETVRKA